MMSPGVAAGLSWHVPDAKLEMPNCACAAGVAVSAMVLRRGASDMIRARLRVFELVVKLCLCITSLLCFLFYRYCILLFWEKQAFLNKYFLCFCRTLLL